MQPREIKALEIAAKSKLVRSNGNTWYVPSQSNRKESTRLLWTMKARNALVQTMKFGFDFEFEQD